MPELNVPFTFSFKGKKMTIYYSRSKKTADIINTINEILNDNIVSDQIGQCVNELLANTVDRDVPSISELLKTLGPLTFEEGEGIKNAIDNIVGEEFTIDAANFMVAKIESLAELDIEAAQSLQRKLFQHCLNAQVKKQENAAGLACIAVRTFHLNWRY